MTSILSFDFSFLILHRYPLLAFVVLACAVGVYRFVADFSAEDFFESKLFHCAHLVDIVRLIIVVLGNSREDIAEEIDQAVVAGHRVTIVVIGRDVVEVWIKYRAVTAAESEVHLEVIL